MTRIYRKTGLLAVALIALSIIITALPKSASAEESTSLASPQIVSSEFSEYVAQDGKTYINRSYIRAEQQPASTNSLANIYHAVSYNENVQTGWWQSAVFGIGGTADLDTTRQNISVAFLCALPKEGAPESNIAYTDFKNTDLFSSASGAVAKNNFLVDASRPFIGYKTVSGTSRIDNLLSSDPFLVDLTLVFNDGTESLSSGLQRITVEGYRGFMELNPQTDLDGGTYLLKAVPDVTQTDDGKSYTLGTNTITVTAYDNAGNSSVARFRLGFPDFINHPETVGYWDKQTLIKVYEAQKQLTAYSDSETSYPKLDEVVNLLKEAWAPEDKMLSDFKTAVNGLLSVGNNLTDESLSLYIQSIETAMARYQAILDKNDDTLTAPASSDFSKLAIYVRSFKAHRFTSQGISAIPANFKYDTLANLRYGLTLTAEIAVKLPTTVDITGYNDDFARIQKNTDVLAVFDIRIYDVDPETKARTEMTANFASVPFTVTVSDPQSYYNIDDVTPIAAIYDGRTMSMLQLSTGTALTITLGGLTGEICIAVAKTMDPALQYFLTIGLPIIAAAIIAAAVAVSIIVYRRRSAQPDEKIKKLRAEVEKQKSISDIARRAKEEEEEINRRHMEEIERERLAAIERVKEERRKKLLTREEELKTQAEQRDAETAAEELKKYELLAVQKAKKLNAKAEKKKSGTVKPKKSKGKTAGKENNE